MPRQSLTLLLVCMLVALLAACDGSTASSVSTNSPPASTATANVTLSESPTPQVSSTEAASTEGSIAPALTATTATGAAGGQTDWSTVGPELAEAFNGNYRGTTVTLLGPFTGQDEVKFNNSIKRFEEATGIDIQYEGTGAFETAIVVRVEGGTAPDLADFPQPGLLATLAQDGNIVDVRSMVDQGWLEQNYNQSFRDIATVNTPNGEILTAIFHRVNGKSLVWYPKQAFEEAGYTVPQTWDELRTLMDEIVADGDTPWCIGIGSEGATGWPATDWMEDIMLRTTSPDNYQRWVTGDVAFTDPIVKNAANIMGEIWFNDDYVYGGRQQILSTSFRDAPIPMFQDPPKCYLHRQGNFITSFFEGAKPGVKAGIDYDFFYLPPIDEQYGKPVLFAGDLMAAFNDRPEVRAVLQYWTTFDGIRDWVAAGGALSPHNDADPSVYNNAVDARIADLVRTSDIYFDGSDVMPGQVGSGSFWKGMTDWVSGTATLDQAMEEIQAGWTGVQR